MNIKKLLSAVLSLSISISLLMPSVEVMADDTPAPSETQSTEPSEKETQAPKQTEKTKPAAKETQETSVPEKTEPVESETEVAETTVPKESEPTESGETASTEPTESSNAKQPDEKETQASESTVTTESEATEKHEPSESEPTEGQPSERNESDPEATEEAVTDPSQDKKEAANGLVVAGEFGKNLKWSYDYSGVLTISGTGEMPNWGKFSEVPWKYWQSNLKSVIFSDGITSIGDFAFCNCSKINSLVIPDSVTYIGKSAFSGCNQLVNVNLPDSVTFIGEYAFRSCNGLLSFTIPPKVKTISPNTFAYCSSITSVYCSESMESIGNNAFYSCSKLTTVNLPSNLRTIGDEAFALCTELKNITIPESVTSIGTAAFSQCNCIESVKLPDGIVSIADKAFYDCVGLKQLTIPNGVTTIGEQAFWRCESLIDITIPESVITIKSWAFAITGIKTVTIPKNVESYENGFHGCKNLTEVVISSGVKTISKSAFSHCSDLTSVTIPDSVIVIEDFAFEFCTSLKSITLPNSITSVGDQAFAASAINSIVIPNSMTSIAHGAFANCNDLTSIVIPNSVTSIGAGAFSFCTNLKEITLPDSLTIINNSTFHGSGIVTINIPENLTEIGAYAFQGCTGLNSIKLPYNLKSIGMHAFSECSNLKSIIMNARTSRGLYAFSDIPDSAFHYYYDVTYANSEFGTVSGKKRTYGTEVIELTVIPQTNFEFDKIIFTANESTIYLYPDANGKVTMPDSSSNAVISASFSTKGSCGENLSWRLSSDGTLTVSGSGNMTNWEDSEKVPWNIYRKSIKNIVFPEKITSIGNYAFFACTSLSKVVIPDSLTTIGVNAFGDCGNVSSIVLNKTGYSASAFPDIPSSVFHFYYDVSYEADSHGTIKGKNRSFGTDVVEFTVTSNENYTFDKLIWTSDGRTVELIPDKNGKYIMPDSDTGASIRANYGLACGDRQIWSFDGNDTLTISGTGEMFNWDSAEAVPWNVYRGKIKNIILSEGITSIGKFAFQSCTNLSIIKVPDSVSLIGESAFSGCTDLKSVILNKSAFNSNAFPDLSQDKFHFYYDVEYYFVGKGKITGKTRSYGTDKLEITISHEDYYGLNKLRMSNESEGDNYIDKYLPIDSDGNFTLTMPDSDSSVIFECIFTYVGPKNTCGKNLTWTLENGVLTISGTGEMAGFVGVGEEGPGGPNDDCPWKAERSKITSVVISEGVTSIGEYAFTGCKNLKSISIPDSVVSIGDSAFESCGFVDFSIPVTVKKIGRLIWQGCKELTSVTVPESVTYIGDYWFCDCTNLKDVNLHNKITSIGNHAFSGCKSLTVFEVPKGVTSIGEGAFMECPGLKNVVLPEGITEIGESAFHSCSSLKYISIPNSVTSIGECAFQESGLESIAIPDGMSEIAAYFFSDCDLRSIVIPASVTEIGDCAFAACSRLEAVYYCGTRAQWSCVIVNGDDNDALYNAKFYYSDSFHSCTVNALEHGKAIVSPSKAYAGATVVISAIPDNGYYAQTYIVNGSPITGNSFPMPDCDVTIDVIFAVIVQANVGDTDSFDGLTYNITNNAMDGTGTVTLTGFTGNQSSVRIPDTVELKGIVYKVTRIASKAFYNKKTVNKLIVGANVTVIDPYAFQGCSNLVSVSGLSRVKTIGTKAFAGCKKLKSFTVSSAALSKIGSYTFSGDKNLKTISIKNTTKLTKKGVKKSLKGSKVKTVKVKKSKVKKYKKYFTKKNCGRKVKVKK